MEDKSTKTSLADFQTALCVNDSYNKHVCPVLTSGKTKSYIDRQDTHLIQCDGGDNMSLFDHSRATNLIVYDNFDNDIPISDSSSLAAGQLIGYMNNEPGLTDNIYFNSLLKNISNECENEFRDL